MDLYIIKKLFLNLKTDSSSLLGMRVRFVREEILKRMQVLEPPPRTIW